MPIEERDGGGWVVVCLFGWVGVVAGVANWRGVLPLRSVDPSFFERN